ncbi:phosphoribosylglycinamide formyltransferase [Effusibacillus dendaii]|uniref:Phosphoribosylglycinamide formyltransferase n=1 Tax=Effusibacillus dendaii TaxID=2743772 RepID=A0A7I8DF23_9BACL|nr:phosphoribosylglycinamide formyltransferase [Effusibacillus dendaii]BCJ87150.1 phosphoribosylglycinamide formyltransferase [Effusibacillus dendaii]
MTGQGSWQQSGEKKIAVFASGSGSNLQVLLDRAGTGDLGMAEIVLVVSDKPDSKAVERAQRAGVETCAFIPRQFADKVAYETAILAALREKQVDFIVLAGYMRLVGPTLLEPFRGRIINLHPSLLPMFPGKDAIGQALAAGVAETGVTVHLVDEGMDTGPIIAQERVPILPEDTKESLTRRIQAVEHRLLPQVVANFTKMNNTVVGGQT